MAIIGCAWVSTEDQSTEAQFLDLKSFGCTEVFRENASGADRERPQLKAAPRRSKKAEAQDRRLVELVATFHNAADGEKPTLARIGRQLERQGIPTKTGARTWAPSSVKALLDRAREQGLLHPTDDQT
ncbi:recombinase family protein [Azospirillum sp. Sh1]|uniref:recombinase family protein n=1 Tax=Azospirillum sp. Sh1 TaxID=2607285 RepID=UPI0011ED2A77|nr:recombinase family protein [Azospirillum sp. Sh1]KAA0571506.1 hypothetical protein FZ029_26370 [Azospirillum sp. Sh1]